MRVTRITQAVLRGSQTTARQSIHSIAAPLAGSALSNPSICSRSFSSIPPLSHSSSSSSTSFSSSSSSLPVAALAVVAVGVLGVSVYEYQSRGNIVSLDVTPVGPPGAPGLNPKDFTPLKLIDKTRYNHNTSIYTFALPDPKSNLNLPVSSCVLTRYKGPDGKDVVRPYTPIDTQTPGVVRFMIKTYPLGNMSQYVAHLQPGDTLDIKGPIPKLKYEPNMKKKIGMLAGGTGITPMLQVIQQIVNNPKDKTDVHLVFANISSRDILRKDVLDNYAKRYKNFHVNYIIDTNDQDKDWKGEVGHLNKDVIKKLIPFSAKEGDNVLIYVCGPPKFYDAISGNKAKDMSQGELTGALKELGFDAKQVYKF